MNKSAMNRMFPNGTTPLVIHLWNKTFQAMITSNVFRKSQKEPVCDLNRIKIAKRTFSAGA
jgi:hypothetical protein